MVLYLKASISKMKSLTDLPNFICWIVDCWEDVFIERQLWVNKFQQRCQVHCWIFNALSGVGVQSIYIVNEVTNTVTKWWHIFSWLLWRCLYWVISCSKSCLSWNFTLFEVNTMLIILHNHFIICYALKKCRFSYCCVI